MAIESTGSSCSDRAPVAMHMRSLDYDVAVFLKELPDRWPELHRLADLRVKLIDDTGAFFDVLPYPSAAYSERSPLMREIRLDGLEL